MVARDDSVIRGSLIACLIFLVLSLCLNFFLWRHGNTVATQEQNMSDRLSSVQAEVEKLTTQADRMKAMLGVGSFTQAQIDEMKENVSDDADMEQIEKDYSILWITRFFSWRRFLKFTICLWEKLSTFSIR